LKCPQHDNYVVAGATSTGLANLVSAAFNDIQTTFQLQIEFGIKDNALTEIRNAISSFDPSLLLLRSPRGIPRFIEKTNRAYVLNHDEWLSNQIWTKGPLYVGQYLYGPGAILLHSFESGPFSWCKNTLIHETLHSVSLYSRIWNIYPDILSKHLQLIEGVTECLTGYVLLKQHQNCYVTWKASLQDTCQIAYKPNTKLFCSLAQSIGISPIANFYLSLAGDFATPWSQFIVAIRAAGFKKFRFSLDEKTTFKEFEFTQECMRSIPSFKKTYESKTKVLDFSLIKP
jgi:hypothetical protein